MVSSNLMFAMHFTSEEVLIFSIMRREIFFCGTAKVGIVLYFLYPLADLIQN